MGKSKEKKENIRERVRRFREKRAQTVGRKKISGVDDPKKRKFKRIKVKRKKKVVAVGPRGGKYSPTSAGKEYIKKSLIKGAIKELAVELSDRINSFIENFKKMERKK